MKLEELKELERTQLNKTLQEGEEICWMGRTAPFPILTADHKKSQIIKWVILAVLLAAFIVGYSVWVTIKAMEFNVVVMVVVLLVAGYLFVFLPFKDRNTLMKESLYCVTSKRVLSFISDRPVIALNRAGLMMKMVDVGDGCFHVTFGSAVRMKPSHLREAAFMAPSDDETKVVTGAVFYHVKDVDGLTDLFS